MSKDTVEEQPVEEDETLESEISSILDAAEDNDDELEESEPDKQVEEETETDNSGDEQTAESETDTESGEEAASGDSGDDSEQLPEDDDGDNGDDSEDDLAASQGEEPDKLEAPEHWSAVDREEFSEQPKGAQEFILKRHKEMEGDYTRKRQQESSQVRLAESVTDALSPYQAEFRQAGLDEAGAIRRLASVHDMLKTGGKSAILQLAQTYGIDLDEEGQEYTDPALRQTQSQLSAIEQRIARQETMAQQEKQEALLGTIQAFESEKGENGKLLHPHFKTLQDDITALFSAGLAKDLGEGYRKALTMRPDLTVVEKSIPKVSQADKVKKAKKAATGIKSSGAVGKTAKVMTLEEEIASQIP